jgi:NAD(P)-dependent dehydrogenase (short-subunit alcohol dehydrogenase family)
MATTGFAKYLATELAPHVIRANNVLPGWISTLRVSVLAPTRRPSAAFRSRPSTQNREWRSRSVASTNLPR